MSGILGLNSDKKRFQYFGKGIDFTLLFLKNMLLTLISFGFYYPWAKVALLNYHYTATELENTRFTFHGTGNEVFKGFIKVYLLVFILYILLAYAFASQNFLLSGIFTSLLYLTAIVLFPLAIHGAVRYRAARSSWKGIYFKYLGDRSELFWKCITGTLITIFTLGIYGPWFVTDLRKYITSHLRFGNLAFDFHGKGETLFWIHLKFFLLFPITLGIYSFWYVKELWSFYAENTEITQNNNQIKFNFTMKAGDAFELFIVNFLLIIFTFGLATPWVIVRTYTFIFRFLEIEEGLNTSTIQKVNYDDYSDATGESALDFFDFDLI